MAILSRSCQIVRNADAYQQAIIVLLKKCVASVIYIRSFFGEYEQNVDAASFSCYFENRVSLHAFLRCFTGDHIALRKEYC